MIAARGEGAPTPFWARWLAACLLACFVDLGAMTASADVIFSVTPIANLGTDPNNGDSVNSSGQVAGYVNAAGGLAHAALTGARDRGVTDLGTLTGAGMSYARSVNDSGQVAGYSSAPGGFIHAFVTGANGSGMRDLGTLGGKTSMGFAVNDAGQVAGYSTLTISGSVQTHAFLSGPKGMSDLGTLGSGTYSTGYALNASGQVTGYSYLAGATGYYHAFLTMNGKMKDLGTLAGGTSSIGQSVNASGQVAGVSFGANGSFRAFLTEASGGTMHDLGSLVAGGNSHAYGVNDKGQVVGYATTACGQNDAFVYNNGKMFDLNTLIPSLPGVHLMEALAINNNGFIVALGTDAKGHLATYLLDLTGDFPNDLGTIPEPSSLISLLVGAACLGGFEVRRRRRAPPIVPNGPASWDECRERS